jgi:hypothetical protein
MGCYTCAGGDHSARGFRSTASSLLNEEGAFEGDVMEETAAERLERHQAKRSKANCDPPANGRKIVKRTAERPGQAVTAFPNKSSSCNRNGDTVSAA